MKKSYQIITYIIIISLIAYSAFITAYSLKLFNYQTLHSKVATQDNDYLHTSISNLTNEQNNNQQDINNLKVSLANIKDNNDNKITDLSSNVEKLKQEIANLTSNSNKIIYYQVVAIINTVNQSLLLQDIKTSISLLESAINLLDNLPQNLLFTNLKTSIQQDMTDLKAQQTYNSDYVLIKINALNQVINNIFASKVEEISQPELDVNRNTVNNVWQRFLTNAKTTLMLFWQKYYNGKHIDSIGADTDYNINNNAIDKLHLTIMNLRHAVVIGDQNIWTNNIASIKNMSTEKILTDSEYNLILPYLNLLSDINISHEYRLSHTVKAVNNLANIIFNKNQDV